MYKAVGQVTGKIYVTGSRADCFRKLHAMYPSVVITKHNNKNGRAVERVYPETIMIVRKDS